MDFEDLGKTLISLIILVFVLAGVRKAIMFVAGRYNVGGVVSFLS